MATVPLTRRPAFWAVYALASVAALVIAWRLFPLAIPLLHLDIKLGRAEAIAKAEDIAERLGLAPAGARTATKFAHDQDTQNYVELEGGGKSTFAALVAGNVFAPFWWEVRLFQPGEVTEAVVRFRPDGTPLGFTRKVPERFVPLRNNVHAKTGAWISAFFDYSKPPSRRARPAGSTTRSSTSARPATSPNRRSVFGLLSWAMP
jgi:hypothetical protein